MEKPTIQEIIMQTYDANAFLAQAQDGIDVNPQIWDRQLQESVKANLVVTPYTKQYDFTGVGGVYRVTIRDAPTASAAVAETASVTVQAFTSRYVDFEPSERGTSFELSRKEMHRAFFDVVAEMTADLGYAMAWDLDKLVISTAATNASTTLMVNNKAVATDIASTDTISVAEIAKMALQLQKNYYTPKVLFVNAAQLSQLVNITQLQKFNESNPAGTVISSGVVTRLMGFDIVLTNSILTASNRATAQAWGVPRSGISPVGVATKMAPTIDREYHAKERRWDIVGVQDVDVKVLHSNGIVALTSYASV